MELNQSEAIVILLSIIISCIVFRNEIDNIKDLIIYILVGCLYKFDNITN